MDIYYFSSIIMYCFFYFLQISKEVFNQYDIPVFLEQQMVPLWNIILKFSDLKIIVKNANYEI